MQKLKIREVPKLYPTGAQELVHCFEVEDANLYGAESAVILYNIKFWLRKNVALGQNAHTHNSIRYVWTYNSAKSWSKLFPYLSEDQIYNRLKKLEEAGAIITSEFNKTKYDRTKWYTTPDFEVLEVADLRNGDGGSTEPIPDINTNINTDTVADTSAGSLIPEIIQEMEKIDIKNKTYYGNKTQREAAKFLIENYSFASVVEMIGIIAENRHKIFNVPTSPVMLRDNWVRVISEQGYKNYQTKSKKPQVIYT